MPKPCGFSDRNLTVLDSHTTRIAQRYVDTPTPKATLLDLVYTHACGHAWMRPPEAQLGRPVTLGVYLRLYFFIDIPVIFELHYRNLF